MKNQKIIIAVSLIAIIGIAAFVLSEIDDTVYVKATVTPNISPENQPVVIDVSYNFADEIPGKIRIDRYIPVSGYYLVTEKTDLDSKGSFSHTWSVPSMVKDVDGSIRVMMYNSDGVPLDTSEPSLRMLNTNY